MGTGKKAGEATAKPTANTDTDTKIEAKPKDEAPGGDDDQPPARDTA